VVSPSCVRHLVYKWKMNKMELSPSDKRVVDLLSKLKNSNGAYPPDILAARREAYLKQMASVGLGMGAGAVFKNAVKGAGNSAGAATITSKILEIALIAAITIEAGTAAYFYRDKIADLVKKYTGSSNVQVVAPPPDDTSTLSAGLVQITVSPSATMLTPSGTPSPEIAVNNDNNNGSGSSVNATPSPDNNGNQYGLTPKPVRTKDNNTDGGSNDNGGNSNGGNGNNNNQP
jgi:hypothetical protein